MKGISLILALAGTAAIGQPRLLVFSGWSGYRHTSLVDGIAAMKGLSARGGFLFDTTSNPAVFNDTNLAKYQAVFMNCNCGHVSLLKEAQRDALQKFIRAGKGWAGTHCASGIGTGWPWYAQLVGAVHGGQHTPGSVPGILRVDNRTHVSMTHFTSNTWKMPKEELYYFLNDPAPSWRPDPVLPKVTVLLTFLEWGNGNTKPQADVTTSHMGALAWYHEFEGGRSWYTGLGHEAWLYGDSTYLNHLLGGMRYVLRLDGTSGIAGRIPWLAPDGPRARAWIGRVDRGAASLTPYPQGHRVFDIRGNRLRGKGDASETSSLSSSFLVGIGVSHD
jgi:type 1 glutamine amidotransferase